MYAKLILNIILVLITTVIQVAIISAFAGWLKNLNLIIVILVFIISLYNFYYAWWWAIGIGALLGIFSFLPFGIEIASLSLSVLLARFLLVNFFTNRSLYSFLSLTFFSLLAYKLLILSLTLLVYTIGQMEFSIIIDRNFWTIELHALIINLATVVIGFYLVNIFTKSLKPVFLFRSK